MSNTFAGFVKKYRLDPNQFQETNTWIIILLLSLLVSATLFGVAIIFIYYQKLIGLYKFQQNFINGFTHELKTPIASLKLYIDTFLRYDLTKDEQKKYLEFMSKDTDRLTLNVNQILHLGRIEDKKLTINLVEYEMQNYLTDFISKNPHYFDDIDLKFNQDKKSKFYSSIDQELFEMVIINIITNAINHSNLERGELNISFSKSGECLEISFKDNGRGIPIKEEKNIFKKMYQIGKRSKGSGIGLYLSTNIMKLHKGKLTLRQIKEHAGANFVIILPLNRSLEKA